MSFDSVLPIMNGHTNSNGTPKDLMEEWDKSLKEARAVAEFQGDKLLANNIKLTGICYDMWKVLRPRNVPEITKIATKLLFRRGLDVRIWPSVNRSACSRLLLPAGSSRRRSRRLISQ